MDSGLNENLVVLHTGSNDVEFFGPPVTHANGEANIIDGFGGEGEVWDVIPTDDDSGLFYIDAISGEEGTRLSHANGDIYLTDERGEGEQWEFIPLNPGGG